MSGQSNRDPIEAAFQQAVNDFKSSVKDGVYQQILATKTIDDVYDATDKLQKEQVKEGHLRHLRKIEPFLENLREYASVIEVFVQSKPDILALIWGPVKLLLQWTKVLKQSFDAITSTLSEIGNLLPEFKKMTKLFGNKPQINHVLLLFFKDILQFYVIALKFFGLPRWNIIFESMWPRRREQIKVVMDNIERHKLLFRNEVRLEDIEAAYQARMRAFQHFEAAERSHRHQEYQAIRQYIDPKSYATKLDWLSLRVCPGTEKWLMADANYKKWIDLTDSTTNLLWLQGIPGAGKTFLSGLITKKAIQARTAAYAFLSYSQVDSTSALSVLQSLLFHLAEDNEDIQEALCRSSRTNLKSDIEMTFDLLVTAIALVGTVFIIVDGLDEMQEFERRVLLQQLLRLNETSKEAKILVSSRAESDISLELRQKPTIRVDSYNAASIERFVHENTDKWFRETQFSADMQSEIRGLLAPLPSSSKGMFLYARIILDSVKGLDDLEDIRSELRVLPASLNEAYARIFVRINELKPTAKQKARRLLSWVGCSPTPLTIHELEAALLIRYDTNDADCVQGMAGTLDVTKFCGPIVEVVDEFVQLVHFTVKEYIFSVSIPDHIQIVDAKLELALCCIFYLRQYHHDLDRTDDAIVQSILSGSYRLHNFAKLMWYGLVEAYVTSVSPQPISPRLLDQLEFFIHDRWTHHDDEGEEDKKEKQQEPTNDLKVRIWNTLKSSSPQTYAFLCAFGQFHNILRNSEFDVEKANWAHLDPTSTSEISVSIHRKMNELLSRAANTSVGANRAAIERYYGKRAFKCKYVSCVYHRHGFESYTARKAHAKNHERLWTCSIPGCDNAGLGFLSRKMRDEHMNLCHNSGKPAVTSDPGTDDFNSFDLLIDLIEADQVEHLRTLLLTDNGLWRRVKPARLNSWQFELKIFERLAYASSEMLKLVASSFTTGLGTEGLEKTLIKSAEIKNMETFQCAKDMLTDLNLCSILSDKGLISAMTEAIISLDDEDMWEEWYLVLQDFVKGKKPRRVSRRGFHWGELFGKVVHNDLQQSKLITLWELLIASKDMSGRDLGVALCAAAQHPTLTRLAEFCLDNGADIDFRNAKNVPTALHYAVRRSSADAAAMVKLLLFRGADPEIGTEGKSPYAFGKPQKVLRRRVQDEKGAREIQKWLGKTWTELVAETEPYRKQKEKDLALEGDSVSAVKD